MVSWTLNSNVAAKKSQKGAARVVETLARTGSQSRGRSRTFLYVDAFP